MEPEPEFRCCRKVELESKCCFTSEPYENECSSFDDDTEAICDDFFECKVRKYFETAKGIPALDLEDVLLECWSDFNHELSRPPAEFTVQEFLETASTKRDDQFSKFVDSTANFALSNMDTFDILARVLWCRIAKLFNDHLTESLDDLHMTSKNFTCATGKLHELFFTEEYRSDIINAYHVEEWSDLDDGQRSLAAQLLFYLFRMFIGECEKRVKNQQQESCPFTVDEMEDQGKGKIRYVGGWALRKSLDKSRRYVEENRTSEVTGVLERVRKEMRKVTLLENNIITPFFILNDVTTNPKTLDVTESRQFRERGLLHISDDAHGFFMSLEQERINNTNCQKLTDHQANMVDVSIKAVSNNTTLQGQFGNLFKFAISNIAKLTSPLVV